MEKAPELPSVSHPRQGIDRLHCPELPRWPICEAARLCGKAGKVSVLDFCKDALIRKFGDSWYEEAQQAQILWREAQS